MHDSAFRIGELVMRTYCDLPNAAVLEVGSLNVNGCLRDAAHAGTRYVGIDLEEGPSVDLVLTPGDDFPVEDESFDLVMASSVFEHDSRFWDTFVRMCRAARTGGHIYVNAPSNGTVHRYPMDYWRFYPDAGLALADHARAEGLEVDLVESFIGNRHNDVWNDFVAVFRKGPSAEALNTAFVYQRYPSRNARTWQSRAVYNESDASEDMTLIDELGRRCETLSGQEGELEQLRTALKLEEGKRQSLNDEIERRSATFAEAEMDGDRTTPTDGELASQLSTLESNLRQRQEEIEQAWALADRMTAERDQLQDRVNGLHAEQERVTAKLADADRWVFSLAGERRALEDRLAAVQSKLERATRTIGKMDAALRSKPAVAPSRNAENDRILAGLARLDQIETVPALLHRQVEDLTREWDADGGLERHPLSGVAALLRKVAQSTLTSSAETDALRSAVTMLTEQKSALHKDIQMLLQRIEEGRPVDQNAQTSIAHLTESLAALRVDALEYHGTAARAVEQLEGLKAENKQQARKIRALEDAVIRKDRDLNWFRRLYARLNSRGSAWAALLPPAMRANRITAMLKKDGLFDGEAYLAKYPDVAEAGINPLRHYVMHGMAEGRHTEGPA